MSDVRDPDTDQVSPTPNDRQSVHDRIADEIRASMADDMSGVTVILLSELESRKQLGLTKYGTVLQPFNGRDMLRDALDEVVDGLVYVVGAALEDEETGGVDEREADYLAEAAEGLTDAAAALISLQILRG